MTMMRMSEISMFAAVARGDWEAGERQVGREDADSSRVKLLREGDTLS